MTSSAGNSNAGYTLLELLLVVAILAGMLALVPPLFDRAIAGSEPRTAARQLVAALRQARSEAVASRRPVAFTLDLEQRRYQVGAAPAVTLPRALELTLVTADREVHSAGRGAIRFFADGSATGGRITLDKGAAHWAVDVAWLSGQVSLSESP